MAFFPHMGGNEEKYVKETFDSNLVGSVRSYNINSFENDLKKYLGDQSEVSAVNSRIQLTDLGLIVLSFKSGYVVFCQSMTFSASANPILYQGATPIFIDSEPNTWKLCPKALEDPIIDRLIKGAEKN